MAEQFALNIYFSATLVCYADNNKERCTDNQSQFKRNRQILELSLAYINPPTTGNVKLHNDVI
jgi:hypothetical protein